MARRKAASFMELRLQKTKRDRRGRDKKLVASVDFVRPPDETMRLLSDIKNNENLSWRELAEEYLPEFSHSFVRKVALGYCKSERIELQLGIRAHPASIEVEPCPNCGQAHTVDWCTVTGPPATKGRRKRNDTRIRIAADVTAAQRDALHALAAERGLTWSEYCRKLADEMLRRNDDGG